MDRTACTEPQCLYEGALYIYLYLCIGGYLNSVLRYEFLILNTRHPDSLYLREQGCEDPWLSPQK